MSTTQPIRSKQLLHDFKNYYLTEQPEFRNYTIILIGLNTALRINDILHITWGDVYCGERRRFYTHLLITEKKTGKETRILINRELQETLLSYRKTQPSIADTDYLFPSPRKTGSPLSRYQAYRIVRKAARSRRDRRRDPVPFPAEDLRLPCMENGNSARIADGDLQSFFFSDHKTLSGD